jgi:hypothetical protein
MFFVLSINTRNQTGKIVGHAQTLEEAIKEVEKCSREYVLEKSEPILHHRDFEAECPRTNFYTQSSKENIHHIEVYRQTTHQVNYWGIGKAEKPQRAELIRRFMYTQYALVQSTEGLKLESDSKVEVPPEHLKFSVAKPKVLPTGGFPSNIIEDLVQSDQFRNHRNTTDTNCQPKKRISQCIVFSSDDEE